MQVPRFSSRILYIASRSSGVSALAALPYPALALPCLALLEDNGLEMQV
jgi:hypothetical protein